MKHVLVTTLVVSLILSMVSCSSTYYYSILSSPDGDLENVENGDFLYEDDSLWIAHCFNGEDGPVQVTIFNKSDVPLYVDWNKSALIVNDEAFSYNNRKITNILSTNDDYVRMINTTDLPGEVNVIPPKTKVSKSALRLAAQFSEIPDSEYTKGSMAASDGKVVTMNRIDYDFDTSPLRFSSYITVYTNQDKPKGYKHNFYVTNLFKTSIKPYELPSSMQDRGNMFYQYKPADNRGWIIAGSIVGTVAVVVAVTSWDTPDTGDYHDDF